MLDGYVVAGREFVETYVQFILDAEGLHGLLKKGGSHHKHPDTFCICIVIFRGLTAMATTPTAKTQSWRDSERTIQ